MKRFKRSLILILMMTLILSNLSGLAFTENVLATTIPLPKIKSAKFDNEQNLKSGAIPTINITSTVSSNVQYSVYQYSPASKKWVNVSNGYTASVKGSSQTRIKLKAPLHEGQNSFSIWIKRAGKPPVNKGGYDNFYSHVINVEKGSSQETESNLPKIKSVSIDLNEQKQGAKPTLKITSTGSEKVQYSVYLYSPSSKKWEDVAGGYSAPQNPSEVCSFKSNIPLHSGENSFSIWVKRAGKPPTNKGGYDNFISYKVKVNNTENTMPTISNVRIENKGIGKTPTIYLKSDASSDVEYSVYLYSSIKKTWEDVGNGYSKGCDPNVEKAITINKPLQYGDNSFSIWVKRAGLPPSDKGGYDSFKKQVINVECNTLKISKINSLENVSQSEIVGTNPEIKVVGEAGDGSNVSYKALLYSNSKKQWVDASSYIGPNASGSEVTIKLDKPLEAGSNRILICSKRSWIGSDVYENSKEIIIQAKNTAPLKKLIVIDPGHGGRDPGTISTIDGTLEKTIALQISKKLGKLLEDGGYNVLYTRDNDDVVNWDSTSSSSSLSYRYNFANKNCADIFVSIHCNSFNEKGYGTETLYSKKNPSKDYKLARNIQTELIKATAMRDRGIKNHSNWAVVNGTTMPASLVETGFIDSLIDLPKLQSEDSQNKFAEGIYNGIIKTIN
ncbi:MAG: N-acetylmuramoyl-L-alanine amidase [Clostridium sp.]